MAEGARAFDGGRYIRSLEQRIRALELASSGQMHAKTTIVGGALTVGMVIPRLWISGRTGWAGRLVGVHGNMGSGTATIRIERGDQDVVPEGTLVVAAGVDLAVAPLRMAFSGGALPAYDLRDGDWIRLVVTAAAGSDLSLSVNYLSVPGTD